MIKNFISGVGNRRMRSWLTLLVLMFCSSTMAQQTITGTITDKETGDALPFVRVTLEGTTRYTDSDIDGKFSIEVPVEEGVLVLTFFGYDPLRLDFNASTTDFTVQMETGYKELGQVVVTASGVEISTKAVGYAQQTVSGEKAKQAGNPNALAGLDGKVSGVQVTNASGTPGAAAKVQIRGTSSASGSDPLIVVDGIPIDNSTYGSDVNGVDQSNRAVDLNPEDIKSVTVLKGAAATALWGSRAQNGVIIYTTYAGGKGKLSGSASATVGLDFVRDLHKMQDKYGQTAGNYDAWGPELNGSDYYYIDGTDTTVYSGQAYDNNKEFYQVGVNQNYNLSLSGGSETIQTRASVGYNNYTGVVPNSDFKRLSIRLNNGVKFNDFLKLTTNVNVVNSNASKTQRGSNLSGVTLALYRTPANYDVYGAYIGSDSANVNFHPAYDNPYWSVNNILYLEDVWRIIGSMKLGYDINEHEKVKIDFLNLSYQITLDNITENTKNYTVATGSNDAVFADGYIDDFRRIVREINHNVFLTGSQFFQGSEINLDFLLGFNYRDNYYNYLGEEAYGFLFPDYYNIANSTSRTSFQETTQLHSPSLMFDMTMGIKDWLFWNVSARHEWSSALPWDNQANRGGFFYPGTSVSFVFTELFKAERRKDLNLGKLRVGFGQTGLMPDPYSGVNNYQRILGVWDPSIGYSPELTPDGNPLFGTSTTLQDPDLRPERTTEYEIGLDLEFWGERLTFGATYYNRVTRGGLYYVPVHPSTGYSEMYTNATDIRNQGIEIQLGATPIDKENFQWDMMFNIYHNKNKVLQINSDIKEFGELGFSNSVQNFMVEGQPFLVFYGYDWLRNDAGDLILREATDGSGNPLGYYLPVVDGSEKKMLGDPNPKVSIGWNNTFTFYGFTVNIFTHTRFGGDMWNGTKGRMNQLGTSGDSEGRDQTYEITGVAEGTGEAVTTDVPGNIYYTRVVGGGANSEEIEKNINWFRIRQASVSYTQKLKKETKLKNITYSFTVVNPFVWTNYSSGDPETALGTGSGAGANSMGLDYFNNPPVRQFIFGVKLNF